MVNIGNILSTSIYLNSRSSITETNIKDIKNNIWNTLTKVFKFLDIIKIVIKVKVPISKKGVYIKYFAIKNDIREPNILIRESSTNIIINIFKIE